MTILAAMLIVGSLAAAPAPEKPSDFLKVESKAWSRWLDEAVDETWKNVPLKDVLAEAFGAADLTIVSKKPLTMRVTFDPGTLSRRAALWRLSQKFGLTVHWAQTAEPRVFLGLPETEMEKRTINGMVITTMTVVMRADYETYQELKRAGQVSHEEQVDGTIYYSFKVHREIHFANGRAHVFAVQRYKTKIPAGKGP